jgi:hypothetical protein
MVSDRQEPGRVTALRRPGGAFYEGWARILTCLATAAEAPSREDD